VPCPPAEVRRAHAAPYHQPSRCHRPHVSHGPQEPADGDPRTLQTHAVCDSYIRSSRLAALALGVDLRTPSAPRPPHPLRVFYS
jgi:hypothetical protein